MTKNPRRTFTPSPRSARDSDATPANRVVYDPFSKGFIGTEEEVRREFENMNQWHLEWLLNFVQRSEVRPGDLNKIPTFVALHMSVESDPAKLKIDEDDLQKFADTVHKEIRGCLIDRQPWRFKLHSTEGFLWPGTISLLGESVVSTKDWRTAFRLRAAELITRYRTAIRRCERTECGRLFVSSGKQTFCTPRCSQLKRLHEFRSKSKGGVAGKSPKGGK